jgi:ParB-like chromosome segregation protein Spo0J
MKVHGFDPSYPIVCTHNDDKICVVDGYTRLKAARMLNLNAVPVIFKTFGSEDDALAYAIHNQKDRRNLTDADLLRCIQAVDRLKARGGDHTTQEAKASLGAIAQGKSSEDTAKIVGTSPRKVEKARAVLNKADPETKQAVLDGQVSINQAYTYTNPKQVTVTAEKREPEPAPIPTTVISNDEAPKAKAIRDRSLLELLVSAYDRIVELKKRDWQGCPKDKVKERLQMLIRLVDE